MGQALQRGQASQELRSWSAGSATQSRDDLEIGIPTSCGGTVLSFSQIRCWVGCITSIRWRWLRLNKRIGDSRECRRSNYCALQVARHVGVIAPLGLRAWSERYHGRHRTQDSTEKRHLSDNLSIRPAQV